MYNVTNKHPLEAGEFYTLSTALAKVPKDVRKSGLMITFRVGQAEGWETYQYTAADTTNINWRNATYWENLTVRNTDAFLYRGTVLENGTSFNECRKQGYYRFYTADIGSITDAPEDLKYAGNLYVTAWFGGADNGQFIRDLNGNEWFRYGTEPFKRTTTGKDDVIRWCCMGDSIAEGYYSDGDTMAITDKSWANIVAEKNDYKITNLSIGGSGYTATRTSDNPVKNALTVASETDFSQFDLVTLAYGINDYKYDININLMANNLKNMITRITSSNPCCKIIVITPLNICSVGTKNNNYALGYEYSNSGTLEDVYNKIVEFCNSNGIEYIDMTHSSLLNKQNIARLLPDGVHPSLECHKQLGRELAGKIKYK